MTARFGICERLLIRLSVMPSLRYSVLGSLLALTKGNTATEEISWLLLRLRDRKPPIPTSTNMRPSAEPTIQRLLPTAGAMWEPVTRAWLLALPSATVGTV